MTNDQIMLALGAGAAALAILVLLLLGYVLGSRRRLSPGKPDALPLSLPPGAEALAPTFAELRTQLDTVRTQIEDLRRASAADQARRAQEDQAWQSIQRVERDLSPLGQLPTLQQSLQEQVAAAMRDLAALKQWQEAQRQRWEREDDAYGSLQRLTALMLGSATAGAAGERVVAEQLEALPPQWRVTNHQVGGKVVEFAIRLPDGLFLPIDSKVVAQGDLDTLDREQDPERRAKLEKEIQRQVLRKATEVRKYVDERSAGFAIAAVSDGLYRLSGPVLPEAYQQHRALIVPYSLLVPFILMVYEQHRHSGNVDPARIGRLLSEAQRHLEAANDALNGPFSQALIRATNARDDLRGKLAAAASAVEQMRDSTTAQRESA
jgi:hypothetical protein